MTIVFLNLFSPLSSISSKSYISSTAIPITIGGYDIGHVFLITLTKKGFCKKWKPTQMMV